MYRKSGPECTGSLRILIRRLGNGREVLKERDSCRNKNADHGGALRARLPATVPRRLFSSLLLGPAGESCFRAELAHTR